MAHGYQTMTSGDPMNAASPPPPPSPAPRRWSWSTASRSSTTTILVLQGVSLKVPHQASWPCSAATARQDHHAARAISNLLARRARRSHQGSITLEGGASKTSRPPAWSSAAWCRIGGAAPFAHLTIEEKTCSPAPTRAATRGEIAANLEKVYNYFPRLKTRRTSQAAYTSGGEQQMCAIGAPS